MSVYDISKDNTFNFYLSFTVFIIQTILSVNNLLLNPCDLHTVQEKLAIKKLCRFTPDLHITQPIKPQNFIGS